MEKVFKDKTRTEETLRRAMGTVKEIADSNTLPKLVDGLVEDCNRIYSKSAIAHNSTMHYVLANDAAYLNERIRGIRYMASAIEWMAKDDLPHARFAELLEKFTDRMEPLLEQLRPVHASKDVAWEVVVGYREDAERFFSSVADEVHAIRRQLREEMNGWLLENVDSTVPLPVKYHDAFVVRLEGHDFYHTYSDDQKVWRRGADDLKAIMEITKRHPHYLKLWEIRSLTADGKHGNAKEMYKLRRLECQQ